MDEINNGKSFCLRSNWGIFSLSYSVLGGFEMNKDVKDMVKIGLIVLICFILFAGSLIAFAEWGIVR